MGAAILSSITRVAGSNEPPSVLSGPEVGPVLTEKAVSSDIINVGPFDPPDYYRQYPEYRHGTTEYWNNCKGFIPGNGEIIIYTDYQTITKISPITGEEITMPVPAIKIGTGNAYVQDLAFVDEWERDLLLTHIQDMQIHVSPQDRQRWDNKLNCENQITGETLILNRL